MRIILQVFVTETSLMQRGKTFKRFEQYLPSKICRNKPFFAALFKRCSSTSLQSLNLQLITDKRVENGTFRNKVALDLILIQARSIWLEIIQFLKGVSHH